MSWKKDWLYERIFDYIRDLWKKVMLENERWNQGTYANVHPEARQPPLERLLIQQWSEADFSAGVCSGELLRTWLYQGEDFALQTGEVSQSSIVQRRRDVEGIHYHLFVQGVVRFSIAPDRKQVVITYAFGPLYGRGFVFDVTGQGRTGSLESGRLVWLS